jgi:hypothetical protein
METKYKIKKLHVDYSENVNYLFKLEDCGEIQLHKKKIKLLKDHKTL